MIIAPCTMRASMADTEGQCEHLQGLLEGSLAVVFQCHLHGSEGARGGGGEGGMIERVMR